MMQYYSSLRENILEAISCLITCLKDTNRIEILRENVIPIINYSQTIVEKVYNPSTVKFYK